MNISAKFNHLISLCIPDEASVTAICLQAGWCKLSVVFEGKSCKLSVF